MTGKNLSRPNFLRPIPILIRTISICTQTVQDSRPEIRFGICRNKCGIKSNLKLPLFIFPTLYKPSVYVVSMEIHSGGLQILHKFLGMERTKVLQGKPFENVQDSPRIRKPKILGNICYMKAYCTDYCKLSIEHRQTTYRYHLGRSLKLPLLRFLLQVQNKMCLLQFQN